MNDAWACANCRSLNERRASRCYRCRTPRDVGSVAPAEMPTVGPTAAPQPKGRYRSSAFRAFITSSLIVAFSVIAIVSTAAATSVVPAALQSDASAKAALPMVLTMTYIYWGIAVAALITFAAWISRVVDNVPVLTGYYPRATPRMALLQSLVPILNFFWIPSILREVLHAQDPDRNGNALIAAALIPIVAAIFIAFWGNRILLAFRLGSGDVKDTLNAALVLQQVVVGIGIVGFVMLVAVIVRVERTASARARGLAAAAA
jgi:hypothetical protein